ncbi:hypothetical protein KHB019_001447 [Microbacterium sp. KHB019]
MNEKLREIFTSKGTGYGLWVTSESPAVVEVAAELGLDWVCIDLEHGYLSLQHVANHLTAARVRHVDPRAPAHPRSRADEAGHRSRRPRHHPPARRDRRRGQGRAAEHLVPAEGTARDRRRAQRHLGSRLGEVRAVGQRRAAPHSDDRDEARR